MNNFQSPNMSQNLHLSKKNLKQALENLENVLDKAIARIKFLEEENTSLKGKINANVADNAASIATKEDVAESQVAELEKLTVSLKDLKNAINE